jgi:hypothetical protein
MKKKSKTRSDPTEIRFLDIYTLQGWNSNAVPCFVHDCNLFWRPWKESHTVLSIVVSDCKDSAGFSYLYWGFSLPGCGIPHRCSPCRQQWWTLCWVYAVSRLKVKNSTTRREKYRSCNKLERVKQNLIRLINVNNKKTILTMWLFLSPHPHPVQDPFHNRGWSRITSLRKLVVVVGFTVAQIFNVHQAGLCSIVVVCVGVQCKGQTES